MRQASRLLRWLALGAAGLLAAAALGVAALVWAALPASDLHAAIPGLHAPVSIDLDADGIPRIRAADEQDAAAALGFLHARDRMFQMEMMRRNASGRLSELVGRLALDQDRFTRTLGLRRAAQADLATLPADVRALLAAYARGVNAWIDRRGRFAAPEFVVLGAPEPWTEVDSLLWGKTMALYLAGNWRAELARLGLSRRLSPAEIEALWPPMPPRRPDATDASASAMGQDAALAEGALRLAAAVPAFPAPFTLPATASNAWAVDGAHAASGHPLLAGDPHLGFLMPGVWYLARIEYPGHVLVGATAPGVPMLVLGHNGHIAWSFTTTGADTQDLFVETPSGSAAYLAPEGPLPFVTRQERIRVRGAADEVLTVRSTRHGPVVSDLIDPHGPILALSAAELAPGDTAAAGLVALDRAASVAEAGRAAALISDPVQNLTVADRDGIGLFVTGRVPVRRAGDGASPSAGADGAHDWTALVGGDSLPHVTRPASGVLVSANEPVASATFLGGDGYGDFRARRILALLRRHPRATPADFAAMQADVADPLATALLPRLRAVATDGVAADGVAGRARALLDGWDGSAVMAAPQPLIFNAWMIRFADLLLQRLGVPAPARGAVQPWPDLALRALTTASGAALCRPSCDALLREALQSSTGALAARFGADPSRWRWGAAHQAVFAHPLLRFVPVLGWLTEGRIAAPGDETTLDRGGVREDTFADVHGASYRGVYDLDDLERSRFVMVPGQSGNPASPLARNLLRRWRDGATFPIGTDAGPRAHHIRLDPASP